MNAGAEKNIAVQSPSGSLATASNMPSSSIPPRTPWAATRHLVARSGVPRMWWPPHRRMGSMVTSCEMQRTNSSCHEFTSGMYFTITLLRTSCQLRTDTSCCYLEVKQRPARMAQASPRYTKGVEASLGSVLLLVLLS